MLLLLLGAIAITLRARLRIPMNIPGHHGIEVMALIMAGRCISRIPVASSISAAMAAILTYIPVLGFSDPYMPFVYIIMGVSLDIMHLLIRNGKLRLLLLTLAGGFAYMMIPLTRLVISVTTGFPYNSFLKHGVISTLLFHLLFGLAGAAFTTGLVYSLNRLRKRS
ncbi:MAG: hypothetical protein ABIJ16_04745 [Bacteroidota bacterium]